MDAVWSAAVGAALHQRGLLLARTPFALTLRGALSYNEEDVVTLAEGGDAEGPSLGLEVCVFETAGGVEHLLYSPVDPIVLLAKASADGLEDGAFISSLAPSGVLRSRARARAVFEPAFEEAERSSDALMAALADLQVEIDEKAREL